MRVIIFFDFFSIFQELEQVGIKEIDFESLVTFCAAEEEGRFLKSGFAYFPINPENSTKDDLLIDEIVQLGFLIRKKDYRKKDLQLLCNFKVEITLDCIEVTNKNSTDIVVIFSNDSDLIPLVEKLKLSGIRVEITGFQPSKLGDHASGFIDLRNVTKDQNELIDEKTLNNKGE